MRRANVSIVLSALVLTMAACTTAACGSCDGERGTTQSEEKRVFEVKSSSDLKDLAREYQALASSGYEGTFEVTIAAGDYSKGSLHLSPSSEGAPAPAIDVVVRGGGAAVKPSSIRARSLQLEELVFAPRSQKWEFHVSRSITMQRVAVIGRGLSDYDVDAPLFSILADGADVTARIEGCWFVRNKQDTSSMAGAPGLQLLHFGAVGAGKTYWDAIEIADSVFLGNAFATELGIRYAKEATIARSLLYRTWSEDAVFVKSVSSGAVAIEDSILVVEHLDHIARHGDESPPIRIGAGSNIYVRAWQPNSEPPASLAADPAQILSRAGIEAGDARFAEAIGMDRDQLPPADLKAELEAALRP